MNSATTLPFRVYVPFISYTNAQKNYGIEVDKSDNFEMDSKKFYELCMRDRRAAIDYLKAMPSNPQMVSYTTRNGNSLVHFVAEDGDCELMSLLIHHQVDLAMTNNKGQTPIDIAVLCDNLEAVDVIVHTSRSLITRFTVRQAIHNRSNAVMTKLLESISLNRCVPITAYADRTRLRRCHLCMALNYAIKIMNNEIVTTLIDLHLSTEGIACPEPDHWIDEDEGCKLISLDGSVRVDRYTHLLSKLTRNFSSLKGNEGDYEECALTLIKYGADLTGAANHGLFIGGKSSGGRQVYGTMPLLKMIEIDVLSDVAIEKFVKSAANFDWSVTRNYELPIKLFRRGRSYLFSRVIRSESYGLNLLRLMVNDIVDVASPRLDTIRIHKMSEYLAMFDMAMMMGHTDCGNFLLVNSSRLTPHRKLLKRVENRIKTFRQRVTLRGMASIRLLTLIPN